MFHQLAEDDPKSNPTATPSPVQIMGSSGKERTFNDTKESPCPEDSKPMMADAINRRGGVKHG